MFVLKWLQFLSLFEFVWVMWMLALGPRLKQAMKILQVVCPFRLGCSYVPLVCYSTILFFQVFFNPFYFFLFFYFLFFLFPPFSKIAPCVGTTEVVQTPTLDSALLCSSRAGIDLGRTSGSEDDASPVWEREVDTVETLGLNIFCLGTNKVLD